MKKILQLLTLTLLISGCFDSGGIIEGFEIKEGRFGNCLEKMANPNYFFYTDSIGSYKIKLPKDWWLEKTETKESYGITTIDSSLNQNETRLIAVTVFNDEELGLKDYIKSELKSLDNDSFMTIEKVGRQSIDSLESFWIKYSASNNKKPSGILNYIKNEKENRMFLIHSVVFGRENINKRLCHLQNLVMTFRIEDE